MTYKNILIHADRGARSGERLDIGFGLAQACLSAEPPGLAQAGGCVTRGRARRESGDQQAGEEGPQEMTRPARSQRAHRPLASE